MVLGIDAFNLKDGGGITHIVEFLRVAKPRDFGIDRVVLIADKNLLAIVEPRIWLDKVMLEDIESGLIKRVIWHIRQSKKVFLKHGCDTVFCPGGIALNGFQPRITMSRNMLPFDRDEANRYGLSLMRVKLYLLREFQALSFRSANGLIFLTEYAREQVNTSVNLSTVNTTVIPHGVNLGFSTGQTLFANEDHCDRKELRQPIKLLYVSAMRPYKHHLNLCKAFVSLVLKGYDLHLDIVGEIDEGILRNIECLLVEKNLNKSSVTFHDKVPRESLPSFYRETDISLFLSSCENMPNILLEAMLAGKPILCSSMGPMPEILGPNGFYCDPRKENSIEKGILELFGNFDIARNNAIRAREMAHLFTWEKCANNTLEFISRIHQNYSEK